MASEQNGRWDTAVQVPGMRILSAGDNADVKSVSCAPAGNCAAGGDYEDGSGFFQGFVVSQASQDGSRTIKLTR